MPSIRPKKLKTALAQALLQELQAEGAKERLLEKITERVGEGKVTLDHISGGFFDPPAPLAVSIHSPGGAQEAGHHG